MANAELRADSACVTPADTFSPNLPREAHSEPGEFQTAYSAYRHTKAAWDLALYAPDMVNNDLPDEIQDPLSKAHGEAFDRFMRAPVATLGQLVRKLDVYRDEEAHDFTDASIYAAVLAQDARRLLDRFDAAAKG